MAAHRGKGAVVEAAVGGRGRRSGRGESGGEDREDGEQEASRHALRLGRTNRGFDGEFSSLVDDGASTSRAVFSPRRGEGGRARERLVRGRAQTGWGTPVNRADGGRRTGLASVPDRRLISSVTRTEHRMKSMCQSLAALAMLGLSATTHADDQVAFNAHGTATGTATPGDGGVMDIDLVISLWATHLGKSDGAATYILYPDGSFTGCFMATGVNGNDVVVSATGNLIDFPALPPVCVYDFEQSFTITDGSGAFVGATGGGTSKGQFDLCEVSVVEVTFRGSISRPNPMGPGGRASR